MRLFQFHSYPPSMPTETAMGKVFPFVDILFTPVHIISSKDLRRLKEVIAHFSYVFKQMTSENECRDLKALFLASRLHIQALQ